MTFRVLGEDGEPQLEHRVAFAELERGAAPLPPQTLEDVRECAHAPMDRGLTPACARLLEQCGPRAGAQDEAFYYLFHVAMLGALTALALAMVLGPPLVLAVGEKTMLALTGLSSRSALAGFVAVWASVYLYGSSMH
jgi:hypothetical protein